MSAKEALEAFYRHQLAEQKGSNRARRKNAKPEAEVKAQVLAWLDDNAFSCHAIEAKAVYNFSAGRYLNSQVMPGFSDIVGAAPGGIAVFIELKAPGRRGTLRPGQRAFLKQKIEIGAFACVADSVACLALAWKEFEHRRRMEPKLAKAHLLRHLPPERQDSFDDF